MNPSARQSSKLVPWLLALILLAGAGLRLADLDGVPPGMLSDEAANGWNSYSLLETGRDWSGERWPVVASHAFGANRSPIYFYSLLPFLTVGDLTASLARLPAALGGIASVFLLYVVGARLFDRGVGLLAALLLAFNPWHIWLSRLAHEASFSPLLVLLPMAVLCWSGYSFADSSKIRPRVLQGVVAGFVIGLGCYGYFALRLFLPVFFLALFLVTAPRWREQMRTRAGRLGLAALVLACVATAGPVYWKHLTDSDMNMRGLTNLAWSESDSMGTRVAKVSGRYFEHFTPGFLFVGGDRYLPHSLPGSGAFHLYMAPLMLLGLVRLVQKARASGSARVLLVWVLVYPVADILTAHPGPHALRASPGIGGLILLASVGAVTAWKFLARRRVVAWSATALLVVAALFYNGRYLGLYFGEYRNHPRIYHAYNAGFMEACRRLRPRLGEFDAVFFTNRQIEQPFALTLVAFGYEPEQWFRDVRSVSSREGWDVHSRYGKMHFLNDDVTFRALDALRKNATRDRVAFVIRPGELRLDNPTDVIERPDGSVALWIVELTI